jgi:gliding motility-associated-like protein
MYLLTSLLSNLLRKNWYFPSMKNLVITLVLLLFVGFSANATHLLGGNMGYTYLGPDPANPNNTLYEVTFDTYIDCGSVSWGTVFPENPIIIGAFEGSLSTSSLLFEAQFDLFIIDSGRVEPNLPNNCTFANQNCIYLVRYGAQISLPPSAIGYHLLYDRCCRPAGILNLANSQDEALTFQSFIPSNGTNLLPNSSPVFTDTLASFICIGDTIAVPNSAIDVDGDSLVFSFQEPYDGLTEGNVGTNPPIILDYDSSIWDPYPYPIPTTTWAPGYSLTNMFGAGGFNQINSVTGSTFFSAAQPGIYVVTVEIAEYRNGVQIGLTRRNIQLLAVNCPPNPPPFQDNSTLNPVAVNPTVFVLEEGQNICFDMDYDDPNGDSLRLTSSGVIFDPGVTSPPATINTPTIGDGEVSTEFCWSTQCGQSSTQPYIFNVSVTDNGCPPKEFIESYQVLVVPFTGPTNISGPDTLCQLTDSILYSTFNIPSATYDWNVTGGIISQDNGNEIIVDWGTSATGEVSLLVTSQYGCPADTIKKNVSLFQLSMDAGNSDTICLGDSVQLGGSPTAPNGISVTWSPSTGLSDPTDPNPWATPNVTTTYSVEGNDPNGCRSTEQVTVTVNQPLPTGLADDYYLCPGDTLELSLQNTATATWTPSGTVLNPSNQDYQFFPSNTTIYGLEYTDTIGCEGVDTIEVLVNPTIPTDAGPDTALCFGDTVRIGGNPTAFINVTYSWTGTNIIDPSVSNPLVHPDTPGMYIVETSNDTCTGRDTAEVSISPVPPLTVVPDTIVCTGDTAQLLAITTGTVQWSNGASLSDDTILNPLAFPSTTTAYVVESTGGNQCTSEDTIIVGVQPIPLADAGDTLIYACKLAPTLLGGNPTGPTGATYLWSPSSNLNDPSLANPNFTSDTGAIYTVLVTDTIGCTNSDSTTVSVMVITPSQDTSACEGQVISTSSEGMNGLAPYTYEYIPSTGVVNPDQPNSDIILSSSGIYQIVVTDSNRCTDTATIELTVAPGVIAQFDQTGEAGCDGVVYQTNNQTLGSDSISWIYNGSLISTDFDTRFIHPYDQLGTLIMVGTNQDGCLDSAQAALPAQGFGFESLEELLPNVFTPNGDGVNDYFEFNFSPELADCVDMLVFNRWGIVIYESTGVSHSWDGRTFTGQEVEPGVYFYTLDIKGIIYKGSVDLIR